MVVNKVLHHVKEGRKENVSISIPRKAEREKEKKNSKAKVRALTGYSSDGNSHESQDNSVDENPKAGP